MAVISPTIFQSNVSETSMSKSGVENRVWISLQNYSLRKIVAGFVSAAFTV